MNQIQIAYNKINDFKIEFEKSIKNSENLIDVSTLNGLKIALSFIRKEMKNSCQINTKSLSQNDTPNSKNPHK